MNVLIDTNVILDDILDRAKNAEPARRISRLVTDDLVNGYLTATCITDIFYIVAKNRSNSIARKIIKNLLLSFAIVSVDGQDCQKAINLPMDDFEDALVMVCAEKAVLDYIVTNDKGFLSENGLSIPIINPTNFLLKHDN